MTIDNFSEIKWRSAVRKDASARVISLHEAYEAYWEAKSFREEQAAYHEILLFGGKDGYRCDTRPLLKKIVRLLRSVAYRIELYSER